MVDGRFQVAEDCDPPGAWRGGIFGRNKCDPPECIIKSANGRMHRKSQNRGFPALQSECAIMQAFRKGGVGMRCMQYTIRRVPSTIDMGLRQGARAASKSLNQFLLDTLSAGLGMFRQPRRNEALLSLSGTWVDDPAADKALDEMRTVDEDIWK